MKGKMAQQSLRSKEIVKRAEKIERNITQHDSQLQDMNNRGEMMKKEMAQQDSKSKEMDKRVEEIERNIAQLDWQLQDMNNRAEKLKKEMTHYDSQLQEMGNRCESMQDKVAQQGSQFEKASNRVERMKRVLAQQMDHLKERMEKGMREVGETVNNHYAFICIQDQKTVRLHSYLNRVLQQHLIYWRNGQTQLRNSLNYLNARIDTLFAMSPSTPAEL